MSFHLESTSNATADPPFIERLLLLMTRWSIMRRCTKSGWMAFRYGLRLPSPTIRIAQLKDYRLAVNIAEALGIASYFFRKPHVPWFLERLVSRGDTCLDIGANMGHYAAYLANRVGPAGRVAVFEPQPLYATMISHSIGLNGWEAFCHVVSKAAAKDSGEKVVFFLSTNPHNSGVSSMINHGVWLDEGHSIEIETISLDDWSKEAQVNRIRFAKLDVERAEDLVLMGAQDLLNRQAVDVWWIELVTGSHAVSLMLAAGYAGYEVPENGRTAIPLNELPVGITTDLLFVPQDKLEEYDWILHRDPR